MSGPPPPPRKKRLQNEAVKSDSSTGRQNQKPALKIYSIPDLDKIPETSIGKGVHMRGDLHFDRLLRIDGSFVGNLHSKGNVIVGETGSFKGDMINLKTILVDGGKIEGNIVVDSVIAINSATIVGNITCKTISCDRNVTIRGRMNIHNLAPELIDSNGEIVLDSEELVLAKKAADAARAAETDHFNLDDIDAVKSSDSSLVVTTVLPTQDHGSYDSPPVQSGAVLEESSTVISAINNTTVDATPLAPVATNSTVAIDDSSNTVIASTILEEGKLDDIIQPAVPISGSIDSEMSVDVAGDNTKDVVESQEGKGVEEDITAT